MCLAGECHTRRPGLQPLGSIVAPWCLHVQSLWTKVTFVPVLRLNYGTALPYI